MSDRTTPITRRQEIALVTGRELRAHLLKKSTIILTLVLLIAAVGGIVGVKLYTSGQDQAYRVGLKGVTPTQAARVGKGGGPSPRPGRPSPGGRRRQRARSSSRWRRSPCPTRRPGWGPPGGHAARGHGPGRLRLNPHHHGGQVGRRRGPGDVQDHVHVRRALGGIVGQDVLGLVGRDINELDRLPVGCGHLVPAARPGAGGRALTTPSHEGTADTNETKEAH